MRTKTGGRAKGTPNKVSRPFRAFVASLLDENREQIEADLRAVTPAERLSFVVKVLPYLMPKLEFSIQNYDNDTINPFGYDERQRGQGGEELPDDDTEV